MYLYFIDRKLIINRPVGDCSSEKTVVFIGSSLVFHREFLAHRERLHFVHIEDSLQLWMADEVDSVKIVGFALHPVGAEENIGKRPDLRVFAVQVRLDSNADIVNPIVHVVNHCKLPAWLIIRKVNGAKVGQEIKSQRFVILEEQDCRRQLIRRYFKSENVAVLDEIKYVVAKSGNKFILNFRDF